MEHSKPHGRSTPRHPASRPHRIADPYQNARHRRPTLHLVDYLASAGLPRGGDLTGAHAPLPAELRALRDELDVHERRSARRHVRALRRHLHRRGPSTGARDLGRRGVPAARPAAASSPSARRSSVPAPAPCRACSGRSPRRIPPPIKRAIDALDHFSCSLDVFHEREVDRARRLPRARHAPVRGQGRQHAPRRPERRRPVPRRAHRGDPRALRRPRADARQRRQRLRAARRSGSRTTRAVPTEEPNPCTLAAWPIVAFDGTVVACGNDDVVDGPAPAHLRLGHATRDGWPAIRARALDLEHAPRDQNVRPRIPRRPPRQRRRSPATATARRAASSPTTPGSSSGWRPTWTRPSAAVIEEHVFALAAPRRRDAASSAASGCAATPISSRSGAGPSRSRRDLAPRRASTWQAIDDIRNERGRSTLLFITDRCPVGCAHCSVDSRRDSPTITDFELFGEIVEWLVAQDYDVIGISGGEPFVERRGLSLAARRITEEGKRLVVYTSGVWAKRPDPPAWIAEVLDRSTTVFLSTDAFHQAGRRRRPLRQRRAGDPARRGVDRRAGPRGRRHGAARGRTCCATPSGRAGRTTPSCTR